MEGRTSIVIAHRLSTIRNCDILFVIGNGNILEYGTYDELASDYNSHFNVLKAGMENWVSKLKEHLFQIHIFCQFTITNQVKINFT